MCKFWTGQGDMSHLSTEPRGFERCNLSFYVAIQPENIVNHLKTLPVGDGFVDCLLVIVCWPKLYPSQEMKDNAAKLLQYRMANFGDMLEDVYKLSKDGGLKLKLTSRAQRY